MLGWAQCHPEREQKESCFVDDFSDDLVNRKREAARFHRRKAIGNESDDYAVFDRSDLGHPRLLHELRADVL